MLAFAAAAQELSILGWEYYGCVLCVCFFDTQTTYSPETSAFLIPQEVTVESVPCLWALGLRPVIYGRFRGSICSLKPLWSLAASCVLYMCVCVAGGGPLEFKNQSAKKQKFNQFWCPLRNWKFDISKMSISLS